MPKIKSVIVAALTLATTAATVHAAPLLTLTFKIDNVFPTVGSASNPMPVNSSTYISNGKPVDLQIEADVTITGLAVGTSLGNVLFNVDLSNPAVTHPQTANYAWKPNNLQWIDDEGNSNSVFSINQDAGFFSNDLTGVTAVISDAASTDFNFGGDPADPRPTLGEAGGLVPSLKLGTFKVMYNPAFGQTTIGALSDEVLGFSPLEDNVLFYDHANQNVVVNPATILFPAPEPAALSLLAFGSLALLARRHHRD